ncbi:MAG: peptidoglycan-binding protein [Balneolales bacterium]|nr:peptidoglycan-binding protein [Balneolales bacterium]
MILRIGDRGEEVRKLQQTLYDAGFNLRIDGIYGSETADTVREYQIAAGLSMVDGIAGPETLSSLGLSLGNQGLAEQNVQHGGTAAGIGTLLLAGAALAGGYFALQEFVVKEPDTKKTAPKQKRKRKSTPNKTGTQKKTAGKTIKTPTVERSGNSIKVSC